MSGRADTGGFVGRGGVKLRHALDFFGVDVAGKRCADLGCHVGGFSDCLLQAGAASVVCVDTAYGVLDYKLRKDPRVTVMERTNALHAAPPADTAIAVVVIDLGWTPQRLCLPVAARWAATGGTGARIVTLIKPQYEAKEMLGGDHPGVLEDAVSWDVAHRVVAKMPEWGFEVLGFTRSPIKGGQTRGVKAGNTEFFALLAVR